MDLERGLVAEPGERRDPIPDEVVVGLAVVDADLVPDSEPRWCVGRDVLLPEPGAAGAVREAVQVERPFGEMRQHRRGDPGEVADQLALRDRVAGRIGRVGAEQDLVEIRELEVLATLAADPPHAFGRHRPQAFQLARGCPPRQPAGAGRRCPRFRLARGGSSCCAGVGAVRWGAGGGLRGGGRSGFRRPARALRGGPLRPGPLRAGLLCPGSLRHGVIVARGR